MAVDWNSKVIGPCISVFGEPVTYRPVTGSPYAITGVFDEAYKPVDMLDTASEIISTIPVLGVQLAQFVAPPVENDKLFILSVGSTYIVRAVQPDGHGGAKLMLNFVSKP